MTPFTLVLMDCTRKEQIDGAHSFVATDRSGRFGLQAGHETFVTCLQPGLARYKTDDSHWHYIAQPGATLWFHNNRLQLMTTQFVLSDSRQQLLHLLLIYRQVQLRQLHRQSLDFSNRIGLLRLE